MKPKPGRNHHQNPGPNWEGKGVNVSKKTSRSQTQQRSSVSFSAQLKPLAGKVFYLDLQFNRTAETLESDIKLLGGTVEKFFSKEIKYLVSNKREAKHVHRLRQDSPVPRPDSGPSSPQPNPHSPSNCVENVKSRSPGQVDKSIKSRGKSLVERVVKEQGRVQMDRILSNALEWGVKIFFLDDVLAYIQKKKEVFGNQVSVAASIKSQVKSRSSAKLGFQKQKVGRIAKPFIKVEDSSRHYCPIYLTMPNLPGLNLTTAAPYSPFCVEEKASGIKQQGHRGVKASATEETGHGRKRSREKKKRGGFCECCMVKYDQIKMHLQSERHTAFSRSDEYSVVDRLVSTLHFNFLPLKTKVTRPKCIVSSILLAPGSCGEADPSVGGDARHSEIIKAEEDRILDASERLHPEQRFCAKADQRNRYTYSDGSKHRFLAYKQTAAQKCEQIVKSENPHSDGEFLPTFPSRDNQFGFVDKIPHKDTNNSVSYLLGTNLQSEASASHFSVVADGPEDANKEAVLSEAVQEAKVSSETENKLSEKEDEMPIFSRVQRIQRKIKVYKRKRRKVDPIIESERPELENSILKLWEIFQSSDDMDVEFRGFAD